MSRIICPASMGLSVLQKISTRNYATRVKQLKKKITLLIAYYNNNSNNNKKEKIASCAWYGLARFGRFNRYQKAGVLSIRYVNFMLFHVQHRSLAGSSLRWS